jgi:hypothetical protein
MWDGKNPFCLPRERIEYPLIKEDLKLKTVRAPCLQLSALRIKATILLLTGRYSLRK